MRTFRIIVALSFLVTTVTSSWAGPNCFGTPSLLRTGTTPETVATGDINGDGNPDFVVGYQGNCESGPGMTAYVGSGDGSFVPKVISSSKADPYQLSLGDLNNDGFSDVIGAYGGCGGAKSSVDVLLSNGDGTFQPPRSYHAGHEPSRVAIGDFNNDGNLDVITSDAYNGGQELLLGKGDGTLLPAIRVPIVQDVFSSWDIAPADFNKDGNLDFVFAAYSAQVVVQLGSGDGTFGKHIVLPVAANGPDVTAGDLNLDGNPDIVVVSNSAMTILLGNGDGTFQKKASYPAKREPSPVIADMGTDGIPDVLLGDTITPPDFKLLKGKGDGTFPANLLVPSGVGPAVVQVADFNGDGLLDVVGVNFEYTGFATVLLNTGQCP